MLRGPAGTQTVSVNGHCGGGFAKIFWPIGEKSGDFSTTGQELVLDDPIEGRPNGMIYIGGAEQKIWERTCGGRSLVKYRAASGSVGQLKSRTSQDLHFIFVPYPHLPLRPASLISTASSFRSRHLPLATTPKFFHTLFLPVYQPPHPLQPSSWSLHSPHPPPSPFAPPS